MKRRATAWTTSFAYGLTAAAGGGLMSRWCADPSLGFFVFLGAFAVGGLLAASRSRPDETTARLCTAVGALAAVAVPALLRFLGLGLAETGLLQNPLGGTGHAFFVLGQTALLAAAVSAAWTQGARGGGRRAVLGALLGAGVGALALRMLEASVLIAVAALIALTAALLAERPWTRPAPTPLRARVFLVLGALVLAGAAQAPGLLRDVWTARLHAAYPGGRFLTYRDDGRHVWAGYRYSDRSLVALRDGVIQSMDAATGLLCLRALIGQVESGVFSVLIVDPPDAQPALWARSDGLQPLQEFSVPAQREVVEVLGTARIASEVNALSTATAALLFLPRPLGRGYAPRNVNTADLNSLRSRLLAGAPLAVVLPPDAPSRAIAAVESASREAFGHSRTADLPNGSILIVASPANIIVDAQALFSRLPLATRAGELLGAQTLAVGLRWRDAPMVK